MPYRPETERRWLAIHRYNIVHGDLSDSEDLEEFKEGLLAQIDLRLRSVMAYERVRKANNESRRKKVSE